MIAVVRLVFVSNVLLKVGEAKPGARGKLLDLQPAGRDVPSSPLHTTTIGDTTMSVFKL